MALTWWWRKTAEWTCRTAEHAEIPCDYGRRTVIAPRLCPSHGWKLPLTQAIKPLSAVWQPIHHVSFSRADHIGASHADDGNQCQDLFWRTNSELSLSWVCFGKRRTAEPSSRTRTLGATVAKSWKSCGLGEKKDQLGRWQNSACGGPTLLERFTDNPQDTTSLETPRHQQEVGRLILERVTVSVSAVPSWQRRYFGGVGRVGGMKGNSCFWVHGCRSTSIFTDISKLFFMRTGAERTGLMEPREQSLRLLQTSSIYSTFRV